MVDGNIANFDTAAPEASTATFTVSGGVLGGSGVLNVSGLTTFSGGTMSGAGTTNANGGPSIEGSNLKEIWPRTLHNAGSATWIGTGNLRIRGGGTFNDHRG